MPIKHEENGRTSMEIEVELPGSPEEVWQAIATGPGLAAWFVPAEVEERVGGAVKFHLGDGMESSGAITVWEPPHRLVYEEPDWSEGAPPLATEFIIEAQGGGTCRMRLVHSLPTSSAQWDEEIGSMETGWPPFFEVLKIYLKDFAGRPAAAARPMHPLTGTVEEAWTALNGALGLGDARPGDRFSAPEGAPTLSGMVCSATRAGTNREVLVRLQAPSPGAALIGVFNWGGQTRIAASLFFYGEGCEATAAAQAEAWKDWLARRFPAAA